jgi:hypothetical protein
VDRSRLRAWEGLDVPVSFPITMPHNSLGEVFDVLQAYGDEAKIMVQGTILVFERERG